MKRHSKCDGPVIPNYLIGQEFGWKYICPLCLEYLHSYEVYDDGIPPTFLPDDEKTRLAVELQNLANEGRLNLREQIKLWHMFDLYNLK